ncbi:hypothetical protein M1K46_13010 [Fictibacillus sp. WQ 8-8]|uniref:hypothetical protein n=1 Tax=Fictibacillus sp. WQ 8-8 TaxID=2938788 RepID=UPI0008F1BAF8|nr:hypothetical protein [Fictibacillus sp. WQ 8-8]MCQ6266575.1 hypothetical protein [Fictibacillus sp. WQ 8-8]SFD58629.1 hypothetical protein SAMN05428981_101989 [Bacillus sp. OV194]
MATEFVFNERLGIELPLLQKAWEDYAPARQEGILAQWESIRGTIPDRIHDIEQIINTKQDQLGVEENFERSCKLNWEIAELASVINDLWLWYRTHQDINLKLHL